MSSINLTLKIWRQHNSDALGNLETYDLDDVHTDMSFLEMLDILNEKKRIARTAPLLEDLLEQTDFRVKYAGLGRRNGARL